MLFLKAHERYCRQHLRERAAQIEGPKLLPPQAARIEEIPSSSQHPTHQVRYDTLLCNLCFVELVQSAPTLHQQRATYLPQRTRVEWSYIWFWDPFCVRSVSSNPGRIEWDIKHRRRWRSTCSLLYANIRRQLVLGGYPDPHTAPAAAPSACPATQLRSLCIAVADGPDAARGVRGSSTTAVEDGVGLHSVRDAEPSGGPGDIARGWPT